MNTDTFSATKITADFLTINNYVKSNCRPSFCNFPPLHDMYFLRGTVECDGIDGQNVLPVAIFEAIGIIVAIMRVDTISSSGAGILQEKVDFFP